MVLGWSVLFVEESCSINKLYKGIKLGSVDVLGSSSQPFISLMYLQVRTVCDWKKQTVLPWACTVHINLGEIATFKIHVKYVMDRPISVSRSRLCVHNPDEISLVVFVYDEPPWGHVQARSGLM